MKKPVAQTPKALTESGLRDYTPAEVAVHNTEDSCWIILGNPSNGGPHVYDVTTFLHNHPGGADVLLEYGGKNADDVFEDICHSRTAYELRKRYLIGTCSGNTKEQEEMKAEQVEMDSDNAAPRSIDEFIQDQVWRITDTIIMKLMMVEIDDVMNHSTSEYSPTAVTVHDSRKNVLSLMRTSSANPTGSHSKSIEIIVNEINQVVFPLLDALQGCLDWLADPMKSAVIIANPYVQMYLKRFVLCETVWGVVQTLKFVFLQFPKVFSLHSALFDSLFHRLNDVVVTIDVVRSNGISSNLLGALSQEITSLRFVPIKNWVSLTVRTHKQKKWINCPVFEYSNDKCDIYTAQESYLKENLIDNISDENKQTVTNLRLYSLKKVPRDQVQGTFMNGCVYATWAALLYHDQAVASLRNGSVQGGDDNNLVFLWSLANNRVRPFVNSMPEADQESATNDIIKRATYLLQFIPSRGNNEMIVDFILHGDYNEVAGIIYEYNLAANLRIQAFKSVHDFACDNSMMQIYLPFILKSAISRHQVNTKDLGVRINYQNHLVGISKEMALELTERHNNVVMLLAHNSIIKLQQNTCDRVPYVMGTLTLFLQDFTLEDILSLVEHSSLLPLFKLCVDANNPEISELACRVIELFTGTLCKKIHDKSVYGVVKSMAMLLNPKINAFIKVPAY